MYKWLQNILNTEYEIEKVIKRTENMSVEVMKNRHNGRCLLAKRYVGDCTVYKILTGIQHENLPVVYEAVSEGDKCIVLEEYIEGITVGQILETGLYTSDGVEKVIAQLVEALERLHCNNIVHRDIKPENIILDRGGTVKLIDFNISRIYQGNDKHSATTQDGIDKDTRILGTTGFAAPEQYGIAKTDFRADIYALGILINVMLTGEHPAKKLCSGRWRKVVNRCTKINPDERYQSVREILR